MATSVSVVHRVCSFATYSEAEVYFDAIHSWCNQNCGQAGTAWKWVWDEELMLQVYRPRNMHGWATHICFADPEHATLFALTV